MKRYAKVQQILETAVGSMTIAAHGNFWRVLTREQFIVRVVFGQRLVTLADGAGSAIVKALRGLAPFGFDLTPPPDGAIFPRMPLNLAPVSDEDIAFIAKWIDDGCPDDDVVDPKATAVDPNQRAIDFFREFDDFFQFHASPNTSDDVNNFMGAAQIWPGWSSQLPLPAWTNGIAAAKDVVRRLAGGQLLIMQDHYGSPVNAADFADAVWRFGEGSLPPDPLRPNAKQHQMDSASMWLFWLSSADAAIRLQIDAAAWRTVARAVAGGLVADALFRLDRPPMSRLKITRYTAAQPNVRDRVLQDMVAIADANLLDHNIGLGREARGEQVQV